MIRYHLDLLYIDEAHPAACVMLETGAMSNRQMIKPFFRSPADWNIEQIVNADDPSRGWHHPVNH